ncbi:MAG: AIR synthase-related protein, partial [Pseudomonadota bacterium]
LILSRPLGTGILLAAEMAGRARGADILELWDLMATPQGDAAEILAETARAMTDVTGFGLAGHLWDICAGSDVAAVLQQTDLPALSGADDLITTGIRSSLDPANRASFAPHLQGGTDGTLLFDPQTAGGFLAALPDSAAEDALARLHAAGHRAARIGQIVAGPPRIEVR